MSSIRFIKKIELEVTHGNETILTQFSFGSYHAVERIEIDSEGYNNIFMSNGSVIFGVASEVFENPGNIPVTISTETQPAIDCAEVFTSETVVEPVVLDNTILGKSEDTHAGDEDRGKAQFFTTETQ